MTCFVTGQRYALLLEKSVIPALQARRCDTTTVFMQNRDPPHIARYVKQMHCRHFGDDRIINWYFPTAWPPRSSDFGLQGYLKAVVHRNNVTPLADLKESIERQVRNIPQFKLFSTVERAIVSFQMVADNGGQKIELAL
ncbi:uncharacterized protein TNCV_3254361 [Trichonephila clavipes]|nr:uncharacterized protein TNCV_3254361 [Trichonephila clavipes]